MQMSLLKPNIESKKSKQKRKERKVAKKEEEEEKEKYNRLRLIDGQTKTGPSTSYSQKKIYFVMQMLKSGDKTRRQNERRLYNSKDNKTSCARVSLNCRAHTQNETHSIGDKTGSIKVWGEGRASEITQQF